MVFKYPGEHQRFIILLLPALGLQLHYLQVYLNKTTGSFSIAGANGSSVLNGTFSEPLLGFDAAHSGSDQRKSDLQFTNFGNEGGWSFTSAISGLASNLNEDDQQICFLGFFNASTLGITDGTYSSFTANGTGNFETDRPWQRLPEPSTLVLMLAKWLRRTWLDGERRTNRLSVI